MKAKLLDDCFLHDKDRLLHAEALAILKERLQPIVATEIVDLADASGRLAAGPVLAPRHIPAHTNAAVDGYAFAFADYDPARGSRLKISGRAAAGHALPDPLEANEAARIFTGATMPEGADTVIMQEDVTLASSGADRLVALPPGLKFGANRRLAGEDVKAGDVLISAGDRLRPQDVAAIAAAGFGAVECFARLKVAIISSGDEVIRAGDPFEPGKVYDSNAPMLVALAKLAGAECEDLGVMPDDADAVSRQLRDAAATLRCAHHHRRREPWRGRSCRQNARRAWQASHVATRHQAWPPHGFRPDRRLRRAWLARQSGRRLRVLLAICAAADRGAWWRQMARATPFSPACCVFARKAKDRPS